MKLQTLIVMVFAALVLSAIGKEATDHDKVQGIPQPEPLTVSEKAAILFKPQLYTPNSVCVPFPAVSGAGEVTGGLKGTNGNDACEKSPNGSQVYGRAEKYKNLWAIMYAWYFPKGFSWLGFPSRRHDWKNVVVWIDNPEVMEPKIVGVSMSKSGTKYSIQTKLSADYYAGFRIMGRRHNPGYIYGSKTSLRFEYKTYFGTYVDFTFRHGEYQDLIMWEQLSEAAREGLNNEDNFGEATVPFSDDNYKNNLEKAYPL
ncbi:hypothetical protein PHMEG_00017263 [Phytophthora megakarya]|uniref:Necrosis inducing protein NPP1 n=1 Tax=Phytophthora megakarya TaxID=4795 RepID=A0A225VYU2_9STRA|nr:hypothetical protein PHMEG_00017263 [Phytophthora megakarya]